MAVGKHRSTKILVDTKAIKENVLNEIQQMPKNKELFAVVKANGYGHGAIESARAAKEGGATGFCVAILDEAIELREAGLADPILILNIIDIEDIPIALKYNLSVTVATIEWLELAEQKMLQLATNQFLNIHIKIDTGMGRLGFTSINETSQVAAILERSPLLYLEGIFTHFATADEEDASYFDQQEQRFQRHLDQLSTFPRYVHTSNSAAALWHQNNIGNMVRFGIAMYGLNPSGTRIDAPYQLKPALSLVTTLSQVKMLEKGEGVGYGKTYTAQQSEWIGTIPIGYADGWLRHLQGFSVLVAGMPCEIVGRICMDQCMIRLPESISVGTAVTLIGKNQTQEITMQMVAEKLETIHYEVACTLSSRIPREYY